MQKEGKTTGYFVSPGRIAPLVRASFRIVHGNIPRKSRLWSAKHYRELQASERPEALFRALETKFLLSLGGRTKLWSLTWSKPLGIGFSTK